MGLDAAFSIANSGLANVSQQLSVVSQNVSNANTSGYTLEVGEQTAVESGGLPMGVRTGITQRSVDTTLQAESRVQGATVAYLNTRSTALSAIDAANGTPSDGDDLGSLTADLSDAFTSLASSPDSASDQSAVVSAAANLADGINGIASAVATQRQNAQDSLVQEVGTLNSALSTIGSLSDQIATAKAEGQSTTTLEDQRDTAMNTVSTLAGATFNMQSDGAVQVILPSGLTLPTDGTSTLSLADAQTDPQSAAPSIYLGGEDVTAQISSGQMGANVSLRDSELPTFQAELDEFSHNLADRFNSAGLDLFTDGSNDVAAAASSPPVQAGYVGLSSRIEVNPSVSADPTLVQQGTSGDSLSSSDQTVIDAVLNQAFGTQSASTAGAPASEGLGVNGNLSLPFSTPLTLSSFASNIVSSQTGASSSASADLSDAQAVQQTLNTKVSSVSGVSIDTEMSDMISLQNSYAANARMITTINDLWTQLDSMGTS